MGSVEFNSPRLDPWDVGEVCAVCGSPYVQRHHIFHGSHRRAFAEKYGYVIPLCMDHHTGANGIHQVKNRAYDLELMRKAQRHYEEHYGTREDFIRECGKSFLED